MSTRARRPRWWPLYLVLLLTLPLFWLIAQDGLPDWANAWFTVGVLLIAALVIELWLRANAMALLVHSTHECDPVADSTKPVGVEAPTPLPGAAANGRAHSPRLVGSLITDLGTLPVLSFDCDPLDNGQDGHHSEQPAAVTTAYSRRNGHE